MSQKLKLNSGYSWIKVPTSKTKLVCHIDPWTGGEDITNGPSERVTMVGGNNKQSPPDDRDKSHHRLTTTNTTSNTSFQSWTAVGKPILDNCNRYEISLMNNFHTAELVLTSQKKTACLTSNI